MRNWPQTVISQYNNSPRLVSLLQSVDEWISPDANLENFYDLVWNVNTAEGYGLDVWGRIVVIPRALKVFQEPFFGFKEATDRTGFGQAPFDSGLRVSGTFRLSDPVYRLLILAKAAYNITDGSIPAINMIMMQLFPERGACYVRDANLPPVYFGFQEAHDRIGFEQGPFLEQQPSLHNMMMEYVFEFQLKSWEKSVAMSGALPKPTGVSASYVFAAG